MSTTSTSHSAASTKALRKQNYAERVVGLQAWEKSEMASYLIEESTKELAKVEKKKTKRAPKLDEEGNVIKRELTEGAKAWNANVSELRVRLTAYLKRKAEEEGEDSEGVKAANSECMKFGSYLKQKAAELEEGAENNLYPIENLTEEALIENWGIWSEMTDEEKASLKSSSKTAKTAKAEAVDSEAEGEKVEKAKRGRPSKKQAVAVDSEAEAEPVPAKKTAKAKVAAPVEDSEAEEAKPVKKAAKKVVMDSEAEAEPEPKKAVKTVKTVKKGKKSE